MASSFDPVRQVLLFPDVESYERVVGTGPLTGGPARLFDAKVTFCRLQDGSPGLLVDDEAAVPVACFDHSDVVVRAGVGTNRTADAGAVVDQNHSILSISVNGTRRAANRAHGIDTVHAGAGHH